MNTKSTDNAFADPQGPVPESSRIVTAGDAKKAVVIVRQRIRSRAGSGETIAKAAGGLRRLPGNGAVVDRPQNPYVWVHTLERTHAPLAGGALRGQPGG